jgi:hypothetical protein
MNPVLLQSYQLGVVLGAVVLMTLMLFPGTNQNNNGNSINDDTACTRSESTANSSVTASGKPAISTEERKGSIDAYSNNKYNIDNDTDAPNFLSPHRRLNWIVYVLIYTVVIIILFYSYSDNISLENQIALPLYRQQLQNPTKLLQLTLEAYFPKEASLLFPRNPTTNTARNSKPAEHGANQEL